MTEFEYECMVNRLIAENNTQSEDIIHLCRSNNTLKKDITFFQNENERLKKELKKANLELHRQKNENIRLKRKSYCTLDNGFKVGGTYVD